MGAIPALFFKKKYKSVVPDVLRGALTLVPRLLARLFRPTSYVFLKLLIASIADVTGTLAAKRSRALCSAGKSKQFNICYRFRFNKERRCAPPCGVPGP